jgi:hypothetical protein
MRRATKRAMFRGELRTVAEIALLRGVPVSTIYTRLYHGRELDAPRGEANRLTPEPAAPTRLVRGECLSAREVAERLGVTYQRVQQIEERAFEKIRRMARLSQDARDLLDELERVRDAAESNASGGWLARYKSPMWARRSA